jgi:23S rRNA-/tRNA-specific pseudouridylate synthase
MMASLAYPSSSPSSLLLPPTIIYSDNHLLAVNKPAGWHSVPNIPKKQKKDDNNRTDNSKGGDTTTTTNNRTPIGGSKKCLLTHLQKKGLGGGSNKDFLVPLHRIDQPCTGVLLFGKTSKAASRVTKVWKGKKRKKKNRTTEQEETGNKKSDNDSRNIARGVVKDYLCVVPTSRLSAMEEASASPPASVTTISGDDGSTDSPEFPSSVKHSLADGTQWNQLDGLMLRQSAFSSEHGSSDGGSRPRQRQLQRKQQQQYYNERLKKGRSVKIVKRHNNPGDFYDYDHDVDQKTMRPVNAIWKIVHVPTIDPAYTLLLVRTSEGARHMVRALLAQVGDCPIVGDVRYWKAGRKHDYDDNDDDHENKKKGPLKDRSVALHAYGLYFDKKQLQLGSLDTFEFRAPVPSTWKSFFGIDNHQLQNIL